MGHPRFVVKCRSLAASRLVMTNQTRARALAPQLRATYFPDDFAATLWVGALTSANENALSTLSYFFPPTST